MMMTRKGCLMLLLMAGMVVEATMESVEDTGCVGAEGCDEESANNKFAMLFRQMLAKQRETSMDCAHSEDCPDPLECISNKCRAMAPRRTKIINLYSRW